MTSRDNTQTPHRYVLPFTASGDVLCSLRRTVRAELRSWGLSGLADEAELVVTELATNVLKHVGEGSAATLVLESCALGIRVEIHDTSHTVPLLAEAGCTAECGRGLHLLAEMARDWGAIATASGKAVWCELPLATDGACVRIQRAHAVLGEYRELAGPAVVPLLSCPQAREEAATSLISDLLHWLAAQGCDLDDVLDRAQRHYEAELDAAV
ncbi:ATP-binding protein [Streptomyces phaeochromogenes]|uniref:ATP-binding protein n=1 Tax=Streptomyces phaeochromogenes TaxID=1923 RepID=UPI002250407C|nr:ATP-binding protein [Streptomyces phaeochromogenes]MCX5605958.1 ATP-binding protein [Streptomyces phaeochromogenes]